MLRNDPLLAVLCEKQEPTEANRKCTRDKGKALTRKSTLIRIELTCPDANDKNRYKKIVFHPEKADHLFVDIFLKKHAKEPEQIILDIDTTDDPLHASQEGRFFHGKYNSYCFRPLYVFCQDNLLCARLSPSDIDGTKGTDDELKKIAPPIRESWSNLKIILKGESVFCREHLMARCEENKVEFVLGLTKNERLKEMIKEDLVYSGANV